MRKKYFILFCFSLTACQTLYYPTHEITKKSYEPVKEATVELQVNSKLVSAFSNPPHLFDYNTAYRKGENEIKSSMQNFCSGEYKILSAVKKKEKMRMETHTSTSSSYHSDTHHSGFSTQNVETRVHPRKRAYRRNRGVLPKITQNLLNVQDSTGHEHGSAYGGSYTVTQPVYRKYTEFQFQCK